MGEFHGKDRLTNCASTPRGVMDEVVPGRLLKSLLVVNLAMLVAVALVGWVVAARLQAVVDHARLLELRDHQAKATELRSLIRDQCREKGVVAEDDPAFKRVERLMLVATDQIAAIKRRQPDWFMPE